MRRECKGRRERERGGSGDVGWAEGVKGKRGKESEDTVGGENAREDVRRKGAGAEMWVGEGLKGKRGKESVRIGCEERMRGKT